MHLLAVFFTAWVVGFSGAMMPGPLLTVTISESARRGARVGPLLMLGHSMLELVLVIALTAGLKRYLHNDMFITTVSILGGIFLAWMGYGMLKEVIRGSVSLDLSAGPSGITLGPVLAGILVSLSNPYWTIWWATFGLSYITKAWALGLTGVAFLYTGHILADFTWYGAVSFAVAKGRGLMSDRLYRGIIAVCGAFLVFLAVSFIKNGMIYFLR